ncbi:metallo-beta-lactamase superfamily protein [Plectosphaerella plurivora]|uniref:ribonuclease Z n=1 Tax=Plectosphaerella plurivora TaxID=936078 RepID=A0A9P9AF38_9PEZI|nr:metallo-beta-lactamase superfamily protein [Plectosphaerella plurivora]
MSNRVYILTTPSAETTGVSLLVHFDHRRYLFGNAGQGTQRCYVQRGHSMAKLENLFISGPTGWGTMGGLMGMMLTVADSMLATNSALKAKNEQRKAEGKPLHATLDKGFDVLGGRNITHAVATSRNFVFRTGVPINVNELDEDPRKGSGPHDFSKPDWADDTLRVWQIPVVATAPENGTALPRKRTFDMMTESEKGAPSAEGRSSSQSPTPITAEAAAEAKMICRGVTDAMFNSDWAFDRMFETRLGDVKSTDRPWVRGPNGLERYTGKMAHEDPSVADNIVLMRAPWPSVATTTLPNTQPDATSISYVAKNNGRRGKFDPKAAKALGVAVKDYRLLTQGQSVTGADGNTVTPDMVLGEGLSGTGFALLEVPTLDHVQSLLARPEWAAADLMEGVSVFYWSLGRGVFDSVELQAFMNERPAIKHVIMAPDVSPNMITYNSFATLQTKLGSIDPDRFPLLNFNNRSKDVTAAVPSAIVGRTGMIAKLLPNYEFDESETVPFPPLDEAVKMVDRKIKALAKEAEKKVKQPEFLEAIEKDEQDIPNRDTVIIPLGTGSSLPSKYRNVSATFIRVPGVGCYLLDCGEGTEGQLRRALGDEEFKQAMLDLKAIFISHMHADHHLGLAGILARWNEATRENGQSDAKLTMCVPHQMCTWLKEFAMVEDIGYPRLIVVKNGDTVEGKQKRIDWTASGLESIEAVPVRHCQDSYAGILTWPSGLKIAYSGDCRPSHVFAQAARGAALLLHECTFGNDKESDAKAKKHSTMGEALSIARQMQARRVLLTHFSQRYAKANAKMEEVVVGDGGKAKEQIVLFAWDQMRVKLGEFKQAATFAPAVTALLEAESGDIGEEE